MSVGSLVVLLMETTLVISAYKEFSSVGCVKRADRRGTGGFRWLWSMSRSVTDSNRACDHGRTRLG